MNEDTIKDEAQQAAPAEVEAKQERALKTEIREVEKQVERETGGVAYIAANSHTLRKQGLRDEQISDLGASAAKENLSEAEVKARCWSLIQERDASAVESVGKGRAPAAHNPEAEHNFFSFARLGRQLVRGNDSIDGREAEVIKEFSGSFNKDRAPSRLNSTHSVFVPHAAYAEDSSMRKLVNSWHGPVNARRFDVGAGAAPGVAGTGIHHDKFDEMWLTEALVNQATVLPYINFLTTEQSQDLVGVTENGSIATGFISTENATRSESTGLTFGNRRLEWKLAYGRKDFSQQALDQSTTLFGIVLNRLRRDLNRRLDQEVLLGGSNTGGFLGLMVATGIHEVPSNTNANLTGPVKYSHLTDMIAQVESSNANAGNSRFIMTPQVKSVLRQIQRQTGATGGAADVIISQQVGEMPMIDGYPVVTTNVAGMKTLNRGTESTNSSHGVIFGDLSDITGAYFSGTELAIDPYTAMETGQTRVYIRLALDVQINHTASFTRAIVKSTAA